MWPYTKHKQSSEILSILQKWDGEDLMPPQCKDSREVLRGKRGALRHPAINFFCLSRWPLTSHRRAEEERLAQCLQHCSYHLWRSENGVTDFLSREIKGISDIGSNSDHTQKCKTRKEIIQMLRLKCWRGASVPSPAQTTRIWIAGQLSRSHRTL